MAARKPPLEGRLGLVTGGARGIGRAIAEELLRAGARVVIADLRESDMDEACRQLQARGDVGCVYMDVSDQPSIHAALDEVHGRHGPIDILVNNAGIAKPGIFSQVDPERIFKVIDVDLAGAMFLTRLVLPDMKARGWGRIMNMSSMMGVTASPGFVIYSSAKFGLTGFSEGLERELRRLKGDIHVTAILPPSVKTHSFYQARDEAPQLMRWSLVPPISVERVARRAVRGMIKGRRRVYCSSQSLLSAYAERLSPIIMDVILAQMFRPSEV